MKMKIKAVVFDIDGVLADFEPALVEYLEKHFGNDARINRDLYSLEERFCNHPKILKAALDFVDDPNSYYAIKKAKWTTNLVDSVVSEGFVIVYMTSRPEGARAFTERWLRKNGFPFSDSLYCGVSDKGKILASARDGIGFVLDDSPKQLFGLLQNGINTLCMEQVWNFGLFPRLTISRRGEFMVWEQEDKEEIGFDQWISELR